MIAEAPGAAGIQRPAPVLEACPRREPKIVERPGSDRRLHDPCGVLTADMSARVVALLVALVSGVAMAIQGSINTRLGRVVGQWEAVFVVHVIGLVSVSFLLFALKMGQGDLGRIMKGPWYTPLGGIIGVLIVWGVMASIPKLGAAVATTSIIVGQVLTALVIDHFGLFGLRAMPFTWLKGLGLLLLAAGAKLLLG